MLPELIASVEQLDDLLSEPPEAATAALRALPGDIVVLGVGGKMGPTLARMAKRASNAGTASRRVFGVSRFSNPGLPKQLASWGVEPVQADLLDRTVYDSLPDAANVIFMAGMKFGTAGQQSRTWAMNAYVPALVCERYATSRIAVFSTGNVYGLSPGAGRGSAESETPSPIGEYAMSCLARERIFEHFSCTRGTKVVILRLNYATELRYGVLVDIAARVHAGDAVPMAMGHLNAIWQGDACAMSLQALALAAAPPVVLNIAGGEVLSVRRLAGQFGERLGRPARYEGVEAPDALLSDARRAIALFGPPRVSVDQMIAWIADWTRRGGVTLGKPTHFEERTGRF
jgi:nucleoside-diphosphate-sugar epimerase